jgi:hypothetical protein
LNVEACEPHGRGRHIDEARSPAQSLERPETPCECENRRCQTERHDVGKRIELDAERRRRVGEAREESVERIEHHRDADEERSGIEVGSCRVHDAGVSAKKVGDGEQRRQEKHASLEALRPISFAAAERQIRQHYRL